MAPKFALFTKESKLSLNKGLQNMSYTTVLRNPQYVTVTQKHLSVAEALLMSCNKVHSGEKHINASICLRKRALFWFFALKGLKKPTCIHAVWIFVVS